MKTVQVRDRRLWCPDCPDAELVRYERRTVLFRQHVLVLDGCLDAAHEESVQDEHQDSWLECETCHRQFVESPEWLNVPRPAGEEEP